MRRKFYLKHKVSNEVVAQVFAESLADALAYFCELKKLNSNDLLTIYIITE